MPNQHDVDHARMMNAAPKFCVDCKWYNGSNACRRPFQHPLNLVTGERRTSPLWIDADVQREGGIKLGYVMCGPEARYFEPKPNATEAEDL